MSLPAQIPRLTSRAASASSAAAPFLLLLSAASRRTFATSPLLAYKQPVLDPPIPSPTAQQPHIPAYPYGDRRVYKQSNTGLYGSQRIRFGNRVSERNEIKNRRKWRPNVQSKRLWSAALQAMVRTRVTTRVLRTIDKVGGLDEYLLGGKTARVRELGPWGWKLRWRVMQTDAVRERFAREREALGLPPAAPGSGAAAAEEEEGVLAEMGHTPETLMAETDAMIREGAEFAVGEEAAEDAIAEKGFMREEKKPGQTQ